MMVGFALKMAFTSIWQQRLIAGTAGCCLWRLQARSAPPGLEEEAGGQQAARRSQWRGVWPGGCDAVACPVHACTVRRP